ncbi:MAG: hypothetical protein GXO02_03710 [Epsilonproteobacteria bacterium]|nr:hypothetical protein [Campylobacterota bacterium]
MRLDDERESSYVEDRREESIGGGGFGSTISNASRLFYLLPLIKGLLRTKFGWVILLVGAFLYFGGGNISQLFSSSSKTKSSISDNKTAIFIKKVKRTTEKVWSRLIPNYKPAILVLYRGVTRSGCGYAKAQVGPFYCPVDQKIYLDLAFFDELARKLNAPGDFAQAYVLAHEVGHHVQNLQGILQKVQSLQQRAARMGRKDLVNKLQIPLELQADCYAGIWAHYVRARLEEGDIEEAMNAAAQIGDDMLQKRFQGYVVPDSFTHGTSKERTYWFIRGYKSGKISDCDTFRYYKIRGMRFNSY